MANTSIDNFNFQLIGNSDAPFVGYISSEDPTRVSPQAMVRGSQNVILENTETINNREGIKRYDPADDEEDGIVASFDWNDTQGNPILIRVLASGKLQFYREEDTTWYTLATYPDNTDFSFVKWWDLTEAKELLVMCNGTSNLYAWSGATTPFVGSVLNGQSMVLSGGTNIDTLEFSTTETDKVVWANYIEDATPNSFLGFVMKENITAADNFSIVMNITANPPGTSSGTFNIAFQSSFGSPSASVTFIIPGPTAQETLERLVSYFQDPANNSTYVQVATDANIATAIGYMATKSVVNSLINGDNESFSEQGFTSPNTIIVDGTEYTYSAVVDEYLVNISGTPTEGHFGYIALVTTSNTPDADFNNDFLLMLNNQLITCSLTSRKVWISFNEDYTNFSNTGDLVAGDPDFVILDEFPKGGVTRGDSAYIGAGINVWYEVTPNTPIEYVSGINKTVYAKVTKFSGSGLTAPLGFNFTTTWGEDIIFVDQQNQLRTLGIYRNITEQKSPSLSLSVRSELQAEDFTGGCIKAVGEYVYMVAPLSGKTYLYEIRDDVDEVGNITSKRHWQPPQTWNISRISIANGIVRGYSASNPQLYQLFNTGIWHDETSVEGEFAPYISVARFAYRQLPRRNKLIGFDKVYYEGYILPNSDLTSNIYYDYRGATFLDEVILSANGDNPVLFGGDGVTLIGGDVIGNTTLGGGRRDEDYANSLPKFRAIANIPLKNSFEYQLELVSEQLNSRWQIISLGANEREVTDNPIQLQLPT